MNDRERARAILSYDNYDRLPLVHFGYWTETLEKWSVEGHITRQQATDWRDSNTVDDEVSGQLGFDFNWSTCFSPNSRLAPPIERKVLEQMADGRRKVLNEDGAIVIEKEGVTSIPTEVDHILKGRQEWEEYFLPRLQFSETRVTSAIVKMGDSYSAYDRRGRDYLRRGSWDSPYGLHVGSLYGVIRNWLGLVGSAYIQVDDSELFREIIDTVGDLCYRNVEYVLQDGAQFDFAHFWEDICFKSGPLINPTVFREQVAPWYRKITTLLREYGITIVSLDCDGKIDALVPIWLGGGVNTMFPIEVGTWNASIKPWREKYGTELRGVGGMDKRVFSRDYAAIDREIERLRPLIELGGYIPCPDHRIAPDAKWENVQYYCQRMRDEF